MPSEPCDAELPVQATTVVPSQPSDYEQVFRPFFVKKYVTFPPHPFSRDKIPEYKERRKDILDQYLAAQRSSTTIDSLEDLIENEGLTDSTPANDHKIVDLLRIPDHKRCRRGKAPPYTVKQLLGLINTPETAGQESPSYYLTLLNALPTKHFHFWDDVRPPYTGTFTQLPPENSGLRKGRNPFQRCLPQVDYDYTSDEEWLGEEDGEELLSELGDEEEDLEDEEDMDDFLDDEEDEGRRGSGALCPLLPFSSGLCWENSQGRNERNDFQDMRLGILLGQYFILNTFCDREC